jgi:hypothetical protein
VILFGNEGTLMMNLPLTSVVDVIGLSPSDDVNFTPFNGLLVDESMTIPDIILV